MKTKLIILIALIPTLLQAQYNVISYEEITKDTYYAVEIKGHVYIGEDSIAAYLYEDIMGSMVLYGITKIKGGYVGFLAGRYKEYKVLVFKDRIEINSKKVKRILYIE
jgi:hypothetical protein